MVTVTRSTAVAAGLLALGILVVALALVWNTAYEAGRSDGIVQLGCVEQAQATPPPTPDCFKQ